MAAWASLQSDVQRAKLTIELGDLAQSNDDAEQGSIVQDTLSVFKNRRVWLRRTTNGRYADEEPRPARFQNQMARLNSTNECFCDAKSAFYYVWLFSAKSPIRVCLCHRRSVHSSTCIEPRLQDRLASRISHPSSSLKETRSSWRSHAFSPNRQLRASLFPKRTLHIARHSLTILLHGISSTFVVSRQTRRSNRLVAVCRKQLSSRTLF